MSRVSRSGHQADLRKVAPSVVSALGKLFLLNTEEPLDFYRKRLAEKGLAVPSDRVIMDMRAQVRGHRRDSPSIASGPQQRCESCGTTIGHHGGCRCGGTRSDDRS